MKKKCIVLPLGWELCHLGGIVCLVYGKNLPVKKFIKHGFPVYGANGVIGYYSDYLYEDSMLLISCRGANSGKINLSPPQCFVTNNSIILKLLGNNSSPISTKYLYYALQHIDKSQIISGSAQPQVTIQDAIQLEIPVAPLEEQKRIVDKIERLFSYLDEGERLLERVQKQLSTYRQAVLKAALTGELTKEWRAENRDKVESGKELLQRVLEERQKSWQGRGKYNEPVAPDTGGLPELPEGWTWTTVDSLICSGPTNGISPKISENGLSGVPSFKLSATTRGEFLITNETIKNIDLEPDKAEKYWLSSGDLLVQRGNSIEYVGTAALFPGPDRTYVYPDLMMKVRPVQSVLGQWMTFCINSRYGKNYIQRKATGTAGSMPKINGDALRYLPIPLPSLNEIEKLIQVLASLQSYCSNHEKEAQLSLRRIDHLRQSILKSAFSGELVDQNLNDEPASELLARIQEEQKQAKASNPRSGRTTKWSASV